MATIVGDGQLSGEPVSHNGLPALICKGGKRTVTSEDSHQADLDALTAAPVSTSSEEERFSLAASELEEMTGVSTSELIEARKVLREGVLHAANSIVALAKGASNEKLRFDASKFLLTFEWGASPADRSDDKVTKLIDYLSAANSAQDRPTHESTVELNQAPADVVEGEIIAAEENEYQIEYEDNGNRQEPSDRAQAADGS